ncbi:MAG: helix-turn-helix domain-containing protein [Lachnospiraceae bacterium]|nr:helix-turn-helix domain-containing protein [Lachnospiraceae bacterium]
MSELLVENMSAESEAQRFGRMIKYLRLSIGMKREDFANYLHIPLGTVRDWEQGKRKMPDYVFELIEYKVSREFSSNASKQQSANEPDENK